MGKRKSAAAWRAFLRALGRTGNARAAAAEAGMDVGTAYDRRIKDARFAAKWAAEMERFRAREAKQKKPLHRPRGQSASPRRRGEELVLRRTRHGDKMVRAAAGRWCAETEETFFAALGRTGCVRAAARAAGISANALYKRREAYPEFAERWDATVAEAAQKLPELLRAASIASLDPEAAEEMAAEGLPPVNVDQAIRISKMHGAGKPGKGGRVSPERRTATRAETEAAVLKLLGKVRRRVRSERLAEGWSETADGTLIPPGWVHAAPPESEDPPAEPGGGVTGT